MCAMNTGSDFTCERLETQADFDMIGFMELSKETELSGPVMDRIVELWDRWFQMLSVYKITCGKITYLAVWLPEEVETYIDETWDKTPSEGFLANSLAQFMCMQVVNDLMPQVSVEGCAPAPRPTESLRRALESFGLKYREDLPVLERRFAVVTLYPSGADAKSAISRRTARKDPVAEMRISLLCCPDTKRLAENRCKSWEADYLLSMIRTRFLPSDVVTLTSTVLELRTTSRTRQLTFPFVLMSWTTMVSPLLGTASGVISTSSAVSASKPIQARTGEAHSSIQAGKKKSILFIADVYPRKAHLGNCRTGPSCRG